MPSPEERRVCLTIGVANARPLEWLPGAANAARDIGEWARCSGFDAVTILTDEPSVGQTRWGIGDGQPTSINHATGLAVTIDRIREELLMLLPSGELTHWLVLHFAGHGLRQDSLRTLWLPSDWDHAARAVSVEALKSSLEFYGIENLTIISDACRDFANRPATANLVPDAVLPRGPVQPVQPGLDRFNAVEDGKSAFMVPGKNAQDARCILSGTLTNALWGHEPKAFSRHEQGRVISDSLLRFVSAQTKAVGLRYGLESKAETLRGFGDDNPDMVYFDEAGPPTPRAIPIAWPEPKLATAPMPATPTDGAVDLAIKRIETIRLPGGGSGPVDFSNGAQALESVTGGMDLAFAIERQREEGLTSRRKQIRQWRTDVAAVTVKRDLERRVRQSRRSEIRTALRAGQERVSGQANLILRGGRPIRVWSPHGAERVGRTKSWVVALDLAPSAQIIVEYADGLHAPLVVYRDRVTIAAHDGHGRISGWLCVPLQIEDASSLSVTKDAIAKLQTTRLSPDEADRLAASIRHDKHANPMLGAIAAYLYDYVGDRDNIRRMAWYYACVGQPIPYDIALLGLLETRIHDGRFHAEIPAVEAAVPQRGRVLPEFATRPTDASTGSVAGLCPWLRQGWDYVAVPDAVEVPLTSPLVNALPHLLNSSFTAVSADGAGPLIDYFRLEASK